MRAHVCARLYVHIRTRRLSRQCSCVSCLEPHLLAAVHVLTSTLAIVCRNVRSSENFVTSMHIPSRGQEKRHSSAFLFQLPYPEEVTLHRLFSTMVLAFRCLSWRSWPLTVAPKRRSDAPKRRKAVACPLEISLFQTGATVWLATSSI